MNNIEMMEVPELNDQMNDYSEPIEMRYPEECIENAEQLSLDKVREEYPEVAKYVSGMEEQLGSINHPGGIMSTLEFYRTDEGTLIARCNEEKTEACGHEPDFWKNTMMVMKGNDIYAYKGGTENSACANEFLNMKELMPNKVYHVDGFANYKTDHLGRVCEVEARLSDTANVEKPGIRPPNLRPITTHKNGLETDDGGHLIAKKLVGSYDAINIVPQDTNLNQKGVWRAMENDCLKAVESGKDVMIHHHIEYDETNSFRPKLFHVEIMIDGKMKTYEFKNNAS